jgi:uncharacterized DUF497 family protein
MDGSKGLSKSVGFEWDQANAQKIWKKHRVSPFECEQIFFHRPLVVADDLQHSQGESRYYVLGRTDDRRLLFLVFTIRRNRIRVITARDMSRKERRVYQSHEEKGEKV